MTTDDVNRTLGYALEFEPGEGRKSGWTLKIVRHSSDDTLHFALHWGDKVTSTHEISMTIDDARDMFRELLE